MEKYGRIWRDVVEYEIDEDPQLLLEIGSDKVWMNQDACLLILVTNSVVYVSDI